MYVSVLSHYLVQEPILTALLIAHFLSDFTFQSQQLANAKRTNFLALVLHLTVNSGWNSTIYSGFFIAN